jgi:hypothetical protein
MKIFLIFLFLLVPSTGCWSSEQPPAKAVAQEERSGPQSEEWDFGAVKKGEIVSHDFRVKNNSERTLTIKNVTTSCGCTASAAKKNVLEPQESTEVSVKFNSKGYNGQVSQFVYVNTDDPDNPILKFTIKAFVK